MNHQIQQPRAAISDVIRMRLARGVEDRQPGRAIAGHGTAFLAVRTSKGDRDVGAIVTVLSEMLANGVSDLDHVKIPECSGTDDLAPELTECSQR